MSLDYKILEETEKIARKSFQQSLKEEDWKKCATEDVRRTKYNCKKEKR